MTAEYPRGHTGPMRVLSLGAGVQSSALALMSLAGEIQPIDVAIFSDTQWERRQTYEHLDRLQAALEAGGVDVRRVTAGNLRADHLTPDRPELFIRNPRTRPEWKGRQRTFLPVYVVTSVAVERSGGDVVETRNGITRRTCTKTYKIEPIERELRSLLGLKPRQRWPLEHRIDQLMGISTDEVERMKDSPRPAIRMLYPLVDELGMSRADCESWLDGHGWQVPRSSCIGCPFHRDPEWRDLRDNSPDEFADAVEFDRAFRELQAAERLPLDGVPYLHDQRVPLDVAEIDDPPPPDEYQLSLFAEECEGFCGT